MTSGEVFQVRLKEAEAEKMKHLAAGDPFERALHASMQSYSDYVHGSVNHASEGGGVDFRRKHLKDEFTGAIISSAPPLKVNVLHKKSRNTKRAQSSGQTIEQYIGTNPFNGDGKLVSGDSQNESLHTSIPRASGTHAQGGIASSLVHRDSEADLLASLAQARAKLFQREKNGSPAPQAIKSIWSPTGTGVLSFDGTDRVRGASGGRSQDAENDDAGVSAGKEAYV